MCDQENKLSYQPVSLGFYPPLVPDWCITRGGETQEIRHTQKNLLKIFRLRRAARLVHNKGGTQEGGKPSDMG